MSASSTREAGATPIPAATARAAVVVAPDRSEVREIAPPEPGPRQVRVRLEGSGVCGSSGPIFEGRPWFEYPLDPGAPGHEGWGVVDAVGDEVASVAVGDRVAALSYHAHATHDLADEDALVRLPPELDGTPFPGEPLGCAMNVFERSGIREGHTVAIVGIGFLGALLTQLAVAAGARVVALSRRPYALEVARDAGAAATVTIGDVDATAEEAMAAAGEGGFDRAIEAVGAQGALTLAGRLPRVRGRLIVAGFHQDGDRSVDMQSWNWRGLDVVNAHERDPARYLHGMREAVVAVRDGRLDPRPLMTHRFELDRAGEAYRTMLERPEGFLKAWVAT